MKIAVIINGISLHKRRFYREQLPVLKARFDTDVLETREAGDAMGLAARAVHGNYDLIIAAGGDGTINQVVNGILKAGTDSSLLPSLAILPAGTGNDFARAMRIPSDVHRLAKGLTDMNMVAVDVGEVWCHHLLTGDYEQRYFLNVADVGMGPVVVGKVMQSKKRFGPAVAYYQSILETFASYKPSFLKAESSDWKWHGRVRTFAIANGQYFGNGLCIAPTASLVDGKLNIFACGMCQSWILFCRAFL